MQVSVQQQAQWNIKIDKISQIRQIFADVGVFNHLVATTAHKQSHCPQKLMPPPTDNIQCHMYEELSQPVAQLLLEPHVSHWQLLPEQPQDFEEQLSPRLSLTNHSHYQSPARELKAKSDKRSGTQPESLSAQPKHIFQHKSGYQKESIFSLLHQQTIKGCNGN